MFNLDYKGKIAIVLGSEGKGIRPLVKRSCDFLATIPMRGEISSLNVSAALSAIIFEKGGRFLDRELQKAADSEMSPEKQEEIANNIRVKYHQLLNISIFNIIQYNNPKIDDTNIVNNIFNGPSHNPRTVIKIRSPYPIGCFLIIKNVIR